jgi:hypothetical protein
MEWTKAVESLARKATAKTQSAKMIPLDLETTLNAIIGWLDTTVTEYTEGGHEAMGRRIAFLYPNNYTLTIGRDIQPTIANLEEEIKHDTPLPFESMLVENWNYNHKVNGWERNNQLKLDELAQFIVMLAEEAGEPTLILPFEQKLYMLEDEPWWEEDDEDYNTFAKLLNLFSEETRQATAYAMGISFIVCDDSEYMSEYCEYQRFLNMARVLEEEHGWFVNLDEHCAACSSGTRKYWMEENPDKPDAPELMTWGQNSQGTYLPNGTMWAEVYMDNEEHEYFLRKIADEYGVLTDADIEDEDYEPTGSVIFGD